MQQRFCLLNHLFSVLLHFVVVYSSLDMVRNCDSKYRVTTVHGMCQCAVELWRATVSLSPDVTDLSSSSFLASALSISQLC